MKKPSRCAFIIFDATRAPDWPYLSMCRSMQTTQLIEDGSNQIVYICDAHLPPHFPHLDKEKSDD